MARYIYHIGDRVIIHSAGEPDVYTKVVKVTPKGYARVEDGSLFYQSGIERTSNICFRKLEKITAVCKTCSNFNLNENRCVLNGLKGYENQVCLHYNCPDYRQGEWEV